MRLLGRDRERALLADLTADVRAGRGRALVLHGDPGIGKTALLSELARAPDVQVVTVRGVESEAELPYAALYPVFTAGRSLVAGLPATQAEALRAAMGLERGTPERFLVAMAALTLLSMLGEVRPVLVLVDDAHWLDEPSQQALAFVSRRLHAERVGVVFAIRSGHRAGSCFADLPDLPLGGLGGEAARELLGAADLADGVRDEVLATADGNPLALRELPLALSERQRTGAEALPGVPLLTERLDRAFRGQVDRLPARTRTALLIMALDDPRDPVPFDAALPALGGAAALEPAERAGLITVGDDGRVDFAHPLVRAAVVRSASLAGRRNAHRALAAALSAPEHRDRRVWHRALATTGPDEPVAAALVAAATRVQQRSGWGTAAKMFARAAELTPEPAAKGRRWLRAAYAAWQAGRVAETRLLVEQGLALAEDDETRGRLLGLSGVVEYGHGQVSRAARLLADAAGLLRDSDAERSAALRALAEHSAWVSLRPPGDAFGDAVENLRGFERWRRAGGSAPPLGAALRLWTETEQPPPPAGTGHDTYEGGGQWYAQCVQNIRALGAPGALSVALHQLAGTEKLLGRWRQAFAHATEGLRLAVEFGHPGVIGGLRANLALLSAGQGDLDAARRHAHEALAIAVERDQWASAAVAYGALGEVELLAGDPEVAYRHCRRVVDGCHHAHAMACLTAMAQAAGQAGAASDLLPVLDLYQRVADETGVGWARGAVLGARAQLSGDADAEKLFEQAIAEDWAGNPVELARLRLAYGRWLRHRRRPSQARRPLRLAVADLDRFGADAWAEQARRELRAVGEVAPAGRRRTGDRLSAQELQIARLAAEGLSNREIGAQLFISPRTVGYHLYKVFPKLGISSRGQLSTVDLE
jgi:DNA-binding CsgD family transcriptional regulator